MIHILPSKTKFIESALAGKIFSVFAELPFIPPQQIYQCIQSSYSFLLESIKGPEKIARYSFIGGEPFLVFKVKNGVIEVGAGPCACPMQGQPQGGAPTRGDTGGPTLKKLKELLTGYKIE